MSFSNTNYSNKPTVNSAPYGGFVNKLAPCSFYEKPKKEIIEPATTGKISYKDMAAKNTLKPVPVKSIPIKPVAVKRQIVQTQNNYEIAEYICQKCEYGYDDSWGNCECYSY